MTKAILVVDDDESTRGMVHSVLTRHGFAVEVVNSGNEAISRLTSNRYDAVVLDIMMPDGSGHQVLEVLAVQRPGVKCVVVISATSLANLEQVDDANVAAKLRKPFDIADLVDALESCLDTLPALTTIRTLPLAIDGAGADRAEDAAPRGSIMPRTES